MEVYSVQLHVSTCYICHLQAYYGDFVFVYFTYIVTVCDVVCVLGCAACSLGIFLGLYYNGEGFPMFAIYW
jgi:hypothetical protein